jgi:hypothetical protein
LRRLVEIEEISYPLSKHK